MDLRQSFLLGSSWLRDLLAKFNLQRTNASSSCPLCRPASPQTDCPRSRLAHLDPERPISENRQLTT